MPCMGPSDREDDADKAFEEIAALLRLKYGVADIREKETFGICREDFNKSAKNLKKALREVFRFDSYNSF